MFTAAREMLCMSLKFMELAYLQHAKLHPCMEDMRGCLLPLKGGFVDQSHALTPLEEDCASKMATE